MEPTKDEMITMTTLDVIADWADLPHRRDSEDAPLSPRGTFFAALGASSTTKPRIVAAIPENAFGKVVEGWLINSGRPSPVLLASAGLVGGCAIIAAWRAT